MQMKLTKALIAQIRALDSNEAVAQLIDEISDYLEDAHEASGADEWLAAAQHLDKAAAALRVQKFATEEEALQDAIDKGEI